MGGFATTPTAKGSAWRRQRRAFRSILHPPADSAGQFSDAIRSIRLRSSPAPSARPSIVPGRPSGLPAPAASRPGPGPVPQPRAPVIVVVQAGHRQPSRRQGRHAAQPGRGGDRLRLAALLHGQRPGGAAQQPRHFGDRQQAWSPDTSASLISAARQAGVGPAWQAASSRSSAPRKARPSPCSTARPTPGACAALPAGHGRCAGQPVVAQFGVGLGEVERAVRPGAA